MLEKETIPLLYIERSHQPDRNYIDNLVLATLRKRMLCGIPKRAS